MLVWDTKIFSIEKSNNTWIEAMNRGIKWWIKSFPQYLRSVSDNGKSQELKLKLLKYQDYLNKKNNSTDIDPIQYLMRLYYIQGLSLKSIWEKTHKAWINYEWYQGLYYLFVDVFWWELRELTDFTLAQIEAAKSSPGAKALKKHNNTISKERLEVFTKAIDDILTWRNRNISKFSQKEYDSFTGRKWKSKKIFYLLQCFSWITFGDIMQASENSWMWSRTIARFINTKVDVIKIEQNIQDDLEILWANISYYLRERKKKRSSN